MNYRKELEPLGLMQRILITSSVVALAIVSLIISALAFGRTIRNNSHRRAVEEMESLSRLQAQFVRQEIETEFGQVEYLASCAVEMVASVGQEESAAAAGGMIRVYMESFGLTNLYFVDNQNHLISLDGTLISDNATHDEYVRRVLAGERILTYWDSEQGYTGLYFAVPMLESDGTVSGGVFATKDVSTMEPLLFFDMNSSVCLTDTAGDIIARNASAEQIVPEDNILNSAIAREVLDEGLEAEYLLSKMRAGGQGSFSFKDDSGVSYYVSYIPVGIGDWYVFFLQDEDAVLANNEANTRAMEQAVLTVITVFCLVLLYIAVVLVIITRWYRQRQRELTRQRDRILTLLNTMDCAVLEYDVRNGTIETNEACDRMFYSDLAGSIVDVVRHRSNIHPEYDFGELLTAFDRALETGATQTFESFLSAHDGSVRWVRVTMVPFTDGEATVTRLIGAVFDVTDEHEGFDTMARQLSITPGGLARFTLDEHLHMEFISDGLCRLLGRDREQLMAEYSSRWIDLVVEEDRPATLEYIRELSKNDGTSATARFRVIRSDGDIRWVTATSETVLTDTGELAGYCVMMDITASVSDWAEKERELTRALEDARMVNATGQMQPHFLYNALASIREIILDDPEYASEMVCDFTTHLRAVINAMSSERLTPFSSELENTRAYVNIEKMRFGDRLNFVVEYDDSEFSVPPLSVQPLVENAIRHGIYKKGRAGGTVTLRAGREGTGWIVQVEDDGVGFDYDKVMQEIKDGTRKSAGLHSSVFRLENMLHAQVTVASSLGLGTRINIIIPGEEEEI